MPQQLPSPPAWRLIIAFLVAPVSPLLLLASLAVIREGDQLISILEQSRALLIVMVIYAYPATLLLGVPAYLILSRMLRASVINFALAGAVVAALPLLGLAAFSPADYATSDGVVTVQNGIRTLAGWRELGGFLGMVAILGAVAGVVFWIFSVAGLRTVWGHAPRPRSGGA